MSEEIIKITIPHNFYEIEPLYERIGISKEVLTKWVQKIAADANIKLNPEMEDILVKLAAHIIAEMQKTGL